MRNPYENFDDYMRDLQTAARNTAMAPLRETAAIRDGGYVRNLPGNVTVTSAADFSDEVKSRSSPVLDRSCRFNTLHDLVCVRLHELMDRAGWRLPEGEDSDRLFEAVSEAASDAIHEENVRCIKCGAEVRFWPEQDTTCPECRNADHDTGD